MVAGKGGILIQLDSNGNLHDDGVLIAKLAGFWVQCEAQCDCDAVFADIQPEFILRSERMYKAPDTEFDISDQGGVMWGEYAVAKLGKGDDILSPTLEVFVQTQAGQEVIEKITRRLQHFVDRKIQRSFEPLFALRDDAELEGNTKAFAQRLCDNLGVISRSVVHKEIKALDQEARGKLRKHAVRFGQYTVFQYPMLKPAPTRLRIVLWSIAQGLGEYPTPPPPGLVTIPPISDAPQGYYLRAGYRLAGQRAVRIDMLERLADLIRAHDVKSGFEATADMLSITGTTLVQFADMMAGLGFDVQMGVREKTLPADAPEGTETQETYYTFTWRPKERAPIRTASQDKKRGKKTFATPKGALKQDKARSKPSVDPDNPFAALAALKE